MSYEPPTGLRSFVVLLQRSTPEDAADLLRMAFDNAAATAIVDDIKLRGAAPALLDACKRALPVYDQHQIDATDLRKAINRVEQITTAPAILRVEVAADAR